MRTTKRRGRDRAPDSPQGVVYLLCWGATPFHHSKHYCGFSESLDERLDMHAHGLGAKLTAAVRQAGISWQLVRTWPGDRTLERRIKRMHQGPRLCPVCSPRNRRARFVASPRKEVRHA